MNRTKKNNKSFLLCARVLTIENKQATIKLHSLARPRRLRYRYKQAKPKAHTNQNKQYLYIQTHSSLEQAKRANRTYKIFECDLLLFSFSIHMYQFVSLLFIRPLFGLSLFYCSKSVTTIFFLNNIFVTATMLLCCYRSSSHFFNMKNTYLFNNRIPR